ncbi:hypothetical protein COT72_01160 [archaeon CG10_big_fil_rev_8_21_14_0_10_43_11]|nr:MAG: hypothetical protein COT72_01160 [archaeon CG10_big_fil_rev_8_21_14_0_10_43_11]
MVRFDSNYLNAMDARYYPSELGTTVAPMTEAQQGVDAQLRTGAKLIEINVADPGQAFAARGSGRPIPSAGYGKEQRQEIKELAQVNKAALTVHSGSSTSMSPLGQQGVDAYQRARNMDELRANVDFAHDIGADSITVHVIGTPRPIQSIGDTRLKPEGLDRYDFVDMKTGKMVHQVSGDQEVRLPILDKVDYTDSTGKKRTRYNYRYDPETKGIQYYTPDTMGFKGGSVTFDQAARFFEEKIKIGQLPGFQGEESKKYTGADIALLHYLRQNEVLQQSEYDRWAAQSEERHKQLELLGKPGQDGALIDYITGRKNPNSLTAQQLRELTHKADTLMNKQFSFGSSFDPRRPETWSSAKERINEQYSLLEHEQHSAMERAANAWGSLKQTEDYLHSDDKNYPLRLQPLTKFAHKQNVDGIADLAYHSYQRSKDTGKKVMINPENIFPKFYGSHPDELRNVIQSSRREFEQKIAHDVSDKKKRESMSEEFIGACFDVAHAGMWRRYWEEEGKGKKNFDDWLADQAEALAKEGIIKKVHVSDHFGYEDDSLPPGQGIVPLKKVVDRIRKYEGKIPIISEGFGGPRSQSAKQVTESWRLFNPHVYNQATVLGGEAGETWDKLHYFDNNIRTYTPHFLAGDAVPEMLQPDFRTWEELPLE